MSGLFCRNLNFEGKVNAWNNHRIAIIHVRIGRVLKGLIWAIARSLG